MQDGVRNDVVSSLIVAAGERRDLLWMGFENMMRSWVTKCPAGTGRGGVLMVGWRESQGIEKWAEEPSLAITTMFCSEFAEVFRLSVSMKKVAGEHPFCILIYMNSYIFHICFILFILFHI